VPFPVMTFPVVPFPGPISIIEVVLFRGRISNEVEPLGGPA